MIASALYLKRSPHSINSRFENHSAAGITMLNHDITGNITDKLELVLAHYTAPLLLE